MLKITNAEFITSATCLKDTPNLNMPELIMIGRSNVGKSSLINVLCNRKNLAYIGKKPGKTKLINLYQVNDNFILTDLPGYGYANRSVAEQEKWRHNIEEYLLNRKQIISAIHLIDSRHEIQKNDFQMRTWLEHYKIPTITVLTKIDCLPKSKVKNVVNNNKDILNDTVIAFSAKTKQGKDEILKYINNLLKNT